MGRPRAVITKRRCSLLMALLAGGAIVNVAVAWGCALVIAPGHDPRDFGNYVSPIEGGDLIGTEAFNWWYVRRDTAFGSASVTSSWHDPDVRFDLVGHFPRTPPGPLIPIWGGIIRPPLEVASKGKKHIRLLDARGWPMLGLHSVVLIDRPAAQNSGCAVVWDGVPIAPPTAEYYGGKNANRILPLRVIWPGFAINTVFYAAVLWMLFAVPLALRKRRRIKRGLCPKCAYDLRGRPPAPDSEACPECGLSVEPTP